MPSPKKFGTMLVNKCAVDLMKKEGKGVKEPLQELRARMPEIYDRFLNAGKAEVSSGGGKAYCITIAGEEEYHLFRTFLTELGKVIKEIAKKSRRYADNKMREAEENLRLAKEEDRLKWQGRIQELQALGRRSDSLDSFARKAADQNKDFLPKAQNVHKPVEMECPEI